MLRRFCRLFCIMLFFRMGPFSGAAFGEGFSEEDEFPDETVVTASAPDGGEVLDAQREKVSARRLQERGVSDAAGALESVPGVQAEVNARGERLIYLRGFKQLQVPVYLDSMPLEIPFDGRLDLSKIPLGLLGSVEVIKAPGPLEGGPTGMGGAIHLRTIDPLSAKTMDLGIRSTAGIFEGQAAAGYSYRRVSVVLASGFHHQAYFNLPRSYEPGRNQDVGRRNNSSRTGVSVGWGVEVRPSRSHVLNLVGIGSYGSYDVPPSDKSFAPFYWRFPEYGFLFLGLTHRWNWGPGRQSRQMLYFSDFRNVLVGYDDDSYTGRETPRGFRSTYRDNIVGVKTAHFIDLPAPNRLLGLSLKAWADYRRYAHEQVWDSRDFTQSAATNRLDVSIQLNGFLTGRHKLALQLQNLVEIPEVSGGTRPAAQWGPGPLVLHEWRHPAWILRSTVARRTRFPSLKERYSESFGLRAPNPDLKPESAWQGVFSAVFRPGRKIRFSGAVFGYLVDDIIDTRPVEGGMLQDYNSGKAVLSGGELSVRLRLDIGLNARLGYTYLYARKLEGSTGHGASYEESRSLTGRTPHALFLDLTYQPLAYLGISSFFRLAGPTPVIDPDTAVWVDLEPRVYWNLRFTLGPFKGVSAFVEATNILDAVNESLPGFPEQGRTFWAGARCSI